jgi:two-component system response regulator (stage 0 sporulation protein A)
MMQYSRIKIALIDDNRELTFILREYLTEMGFDVVGIGGDGYEALKLIEDTQPDIALLDLMMPKMDGVEVLRRVGSMDLTKRPRFIVISAVENDSLSRRAAGFQADAYMTKPFDLNKLVEEIKKLQSPVSGAPL